MKNNPKKSWLEKFQELQVVRYILDWSKETVLPGFGQVPIYDVVAFVLKEAQKDNITTRANSIAFSFFLSIFPGILFLIPVLSHTPLGENYLDQLRDSMRGVIPSNAEQFVFDLIDNIRLEGQYGWLSLGFFLAIFFASNGMLSLMAGFDKSYKITFKDRNYFRKRFVALTLTLLLIFLMIISVILIILSRQIFGWLFDELGLGNYAVFTFMLLRWIVVILLFYSVITSIYRYGPSMYKRIKLFNPGATLATFFSILTSIGFSYFINNFGRYNELYGSIGALIVLLVWMQLNALILLVGFELNASIAVNRDLRSRESRVESRESGVGNRESGIQ